MSDQLYFDDLEELSPENIANILFTQKPKQACTCQLISNITDLIDIFEILNILLLEGLNIFSDNELGNTRLTEKNFMKLQPWIESLGFHLKIMDYEIDELELCSKYYCKIILKDEQHTKLFDIKNINHNYHFLLNSSLLEENKNKTQLKELYSIIICDKKIFKISFDFHYPQMTCATKLL